MTALAQSLIDSSLATSSAKAWAVPPAAVISAPTSPSLSRLRAASATDAPLRANSSAHARPIPCEAPVTSAIRPASVLMDLRDSNATSDYTKPLRNPSMNPDRNPYEKILNRITYPETPCQRTRENRPKPTSMRSTEQTPRYWPTQWPNTPAPPSP